MSIFRATDFSAMTAIAVPQNNSLIKKFFHKKRNQAKSHPPRRDMDILNHQPSTPVPIVLVMGGRTAHVPIP